MSRSLQENIPKMLQNIALNTAAAVLHAVRTWQETINPSFCLLSTANLPKLKGLRQQQMQAMPLTPVPLLAPSDACALAEQKT